MNFINSRLSISGYLLPFWARLTLRPVPSACTLKTS